MGISVIESRREQKLKKEEEEIAALEAKALGVEETEEETEVETPAEEVEVTETVEVEVTSTEEEAPDEGADEGNFKKRYGDLRRHSQAKEKEYKDRIAELEAATPKVELPASDEKLDEWKAKYPDVAAVVETMAIKIADEKVSEVYGSIDKFKEVTKEAEKESAKATIRKSHADFDELSESDDFHDWVEAQPKWVQGAVYENADDPASVISVLDLYKAGKKKNKENPAKEAAKSVKTKSKVVLEEEANKVEFSESQVQKMTSEEYANHEEAIDEAIRKGTFAYDISGGAR